MDVNVVNLFGKQSFDNIVLNNADLHLAQDNTTTLAAPLTLSTNTLVLKNDLLFSTTAAGIFAHDTYDFITHRDLVARNVQTASLGIVSLGGSATITTKHITTDTGLSITGGRIVIASITWSVDDPIKVSIQPGSAVVRFSNLKVIGDFTCNRLSTRPSTAAEIICSSMTVGSGSRVIIPSGTDLHVSDGISDSLSIPKHYFRDNTMIGPLARTDYYLDRTPSLDGFAAISASELSELDLKRRMLKTTSPDNLTLPSPSARISPVQNIPFLRIQGDSVTLYIYNAGKQSVSISGADIYSKCLGCSEISAGDIGVFFIRCESTVSSALDRGSYSITRLSSPDTAYPTLDIKRLNIAPTSDISMVCDTLEMSSGATLATANLSVSSGKVSVMNALDITSCDCDTLKITKDTTLRTISAEYIAADSTHVTKMQILYSQATLSWPVADFYSDNIFINTISTGSTWTVPSHADLLAHVGEFIGIRSWTILAINSLDNVSDVSIISTDSQATLQGKVITISPGIVVNLMIMLTSKSYAVSAMNNRITPKPLLALNIHI